MGRVDTWPGRRYHTDWLVSPMAKLDRYLTREKLLDAAHQLIAAQGFAGTTVDDICAAASVTKGAFFHYFDSKNSLGRAVLERYCAEMQARVHVDRRKRDPLQRVYAHVDAAIEMARDPRMASGCLLGTMAQELAETDAEMRVMCQQGFAGCTQELARDIEEAKARYAPRAPIDAKSLAEHFVAVGQGAFILAKTKQDIGVVEEHLLHFKRYLRGLFGR